MCPDVVVDLGRKPHMVCEVTGAHLVEQRWCQLLLGEMSHWVEEAVTSLPDQVDIPREQRAPKQVVDRVRPVLAHNRAGGFAVKGSCEHRQSGESLPISCIK